MTPTTQNVAKVSAQMIRSAVADLYVATVPTPDDKGARELRKTALDNLREIATQLEQYAGEQDGEDRA